MSGSSTVQACCTIWIAWVFTRLSMRTSSLAPGVICRLGSQLAISAAGQAGYQGRFPDRRRRG
jgi:hypothetical protein